MNLLKIYIKHIYYEKEVDPVFDGKTVDIVLVDMDTDCYGSKTRMMRVFLKEDWEKAKAQGFWMGWRGGQRIRRDVE